MAYKTFKQGEKPKFFVVSQAEKGRYVMTPYRTEPKNLRSGQYLALGKNNRVKLNKWGYAVTTKKPTPYKPKRRMSRQIYQKQLWFGGW